MGFTKLDIKKEVLSAIQKLGYTTPTKIQEEVISIAKSGKNIVGQSQTGTGKTAAFVIPLLNMINSNERKVQALILAPTRELAIQIREEIYNLSKDLNIRSLAVFGGSSIFEQKKVLMNGPQIVVGTPGRVIDLIERKILRLDNINYLVLDEVDRMLDMGFIEDIDYIWSTLKNIKQTMTFSATITPQLKEILSKYMGEDYEFIKTATTIVVDKIDHSFMDVPTFKKYDMLRKYLRDHEDQKVVIFTQTKLSTAGLQEKLEQDGFKVGALHGDMTQRNRLQVLKSFKQDSLKVLVATDVASRGLNMNDIELVVNYDVPTDPESYVHRIGRTARAGKSGKAVMFVANNEMRSLINIEKTNKIKIKKINEHGEEQARDNFAGERSRGGNSGGRGRGFGGRGGSRSGGRGFGGRSERSSFSRSGEGRSSEGRSFEGRSFENKSSEGRSFGSRSEGSSRRPEGGSYFDNKPERSNRSSEGRSFGGRSDRGGRSSEGRSFGERSERTSRSSGDRGFSGRSEGRGRRDDRGSSRGRSSRSRSRD